MALRLVAGSASLPLAQGIAERLHVGLGRRAISRFPDGELHVELEETVRGDDVYLIQSTGPPVDPCIVELLFLADACRRAGAATLTAVVPYFGYARQDRRATGREAVGARVIADLLAAAAIDRVLAVDLHVVSLEGFFGMPVEHLTAVPALIEHIRGRIAPDGVVVSPDLGAAKLAERYARALGLPAATVHKQRISGMEVHVRAVAGEVRDRVPVIVDDMISTAATIAAAAEALRAAGSRPVGCVVATHGVLVGGALDRMARAGIPSVVTTDTLPVGSAVQPSLEVVSVAPLLADAIDRLHRRQSVSDLIRHE